MRKPLSLKKSSIQNDSLDRNVYTAYIVVHYMI